MSNKLLKLYFSREQKDDILDCLIQLNCLSGFSLYDIDGFSRNHKRFDIGEQIRGARRMFVVEVICRETDVAKIRKSLSALHFNESIRYLLQPIETDGHWD